jgi:hypothetical protein
MTKTVREIIMRFSEVWFDLNGLFKIDQSILIFFLVHQSNPLVVDRRGIDRAFRRLR